MSKEGFLSESKNTIAGTDLVKRRRRRRAGATESSESIRSAAILSQLDHSSLIEQGSNGTGQLRRRRRRATAPKNSPVLKTPHPVRLKEPHPINDQQTQIETLAASMAAQTAKKFSDSCIPPQLQSALTVELLERQQQVLAGQIESYLKSQLGWALNQVWLEAQEEDSNLRAG